MLLQLGVSTGFASGRRVDQSAVDQSADRCGVGDHIDRPILCSFGGRRDGDREPEARNIHDLVARVRPHGYARHTV